METGEGRGGCGDSRVINGLDRLDVRDTNAEDKHQHTCCKTIPKRCTSLTSFMGKSRKSQESQFNISMDTESAGDKIENLS